MCFGPSAEQKRAAAEARVQADEAKRAAIDERANKKREDISDALSARTERAGRRGGVGRRSLFTAAGTGAAGYASRFQ